MMTLRILLAFALAFLPLAEASAGTSTIQVKDAAGATKTFFVVTDGSGNFYAAGVLCDQSAAATCASVGTAGSPSTNALTVQAVTLGHGTAANAMRVELPTDGTGLVLANPGTAANWGIGTSTQNSSTVANGQLALGQFNTTPTTITSGNMSPLQMDNAGNLLVNIKAGGGSGGTSSTFGAAFPTAGLGTAVGFYDGTNMAPARVGAVSNVAAATSMLQGLSVGQYNFAPPAITDGRYNNIQLSAGGSIKQRPGADWGTITTWTTTTGGGGTALNTDLVLWCGDGAPSVGVDIVGSGTISAGEISFQYANNATDCSGTTGTFANLPISNVVTQYSLASTTNPLTLTTGSTKITLLPGATRIVKARLTAQIVGSSGQVVISPTVVSTNAALNGILNPLPTGSAVIGRVGIDQTTPGTTNAVSLSQIGATTVTSNNGTAGAGSQRVVIAQDNNPVSGFAVAATGAAPPANAIYLGGNGSGATGGLLRGLITCDLHAKYDASDNGSITMVTGVSGRKVYICGYLMATGGTATNLKLREGSDANCATSAADLTPAYQLAANDRVGALSAFWTGLVVSTNAYYVCVNASAGNAHQAEVWYTIL